MISVAGLALAVALAGGPAVDIGVDVPDLSQLQRRPAELTYGSSGSWVANLNQRLTDAGFHADTESTFGRQTRHAVYAFQKHYELTRDGVFTSDMWDLLDEKIALPWRPELNRIEIDLAKQTLYLVRDGEVEWILPVSSANGEKYWGRSGLTTARTPEGKFSIERHISGFRRSYLGTLYKPYYFRGPYALHGSSSVPNYGASHGCVRVTNWDIELLEGYLSIGETVYVYGLRTEAPPRVTIDAPPPVPF